MKRRMSVRIRIAMIPAVVSAGLPAASTAGQEAGARRTGAELISPEVTADRRVTFRLQAPDAKVVTVYDVEDVPHGEIRTLLYRSKSNGVTRELNAG